MRQQAQPKKVKFTRKVTSKTTVTTDAPLKSCLKRPPSGQAARKQLFNPATTRRPPHPTVDRLKTGDRRGWRKQSLNRFAAPPGQEFINADPIVIEDDPIAIDDDEVCEVGPMLQTPSQRRPPSPPVDFSRYHKFLENYAPYAGDWAGDVPPTPPSSPIEDYAQELYYDWDCVKIPVDEGERYGPRCPSEELLDDPAFYPLAGSMVEGGLMDMMPRINLPEPLMPTPYQEVGPSQHGFCQPESTARHKMVGWHDRDPDVHVYRPDLPVSMPYEPYRGCHVEEEEGDLIGLMSPPPPPSLNELKRLRYTPPPASPPHHPYRGMLGEDPWNVPVTMPWPPERQYSPQRLPRNFAIPQSPPPGPVCLDQSPDYDMGEARWFHNLLTGQTTPPQLREYQPRRVFPEPSYSRQAATRRQVCGAGDIRIASPEWVPPHLREEESLDLDDTNEWRLQQEVRMEEELDRRMRKYGVGPYRKDEYFEQIRHCYDPMDRAPWAPPVAPGPSTWFENFDFPSPPSPRSPSPRRAAPSAAPIRSTPKRAPAAGAQRPASARQAPTGRQSPGVCRQGPPGSGGPPRRRQPPSAPQFKEKLKIDKLPEHLKGKGPTEMTQRGTGPDECQKQAKQQALAAARERQAKAKAYAAQQRQSTKKRC